LRCPAWTSLPHAEHSNEYAESGHQKHAFWSAVLGGTGVEDALRLVDDEDDRETCRRLDWRGLVGDLDELESECAFAIDFRRREVRRLGHNIGRQYAAAAKAQGRPLGAWEIPGSLDFAGRLKVGRRRLVRDAKSGYQDVTVARLNAQIRYFACAYYLLEGEDEIEGQLVKVKPSGEIWCGPADRHVFTPLDHEMFLDEVEAGIRRVKVERATVRKRRLPTVSLGDWCRWCDAAHACPGKMQLARGLVPELSLIGERVAAMTPEEIGLAWERVDEHMFPLVKGVRDVLKDAILRGGSVPMSGGRRLAKPVQYEQSRLAAARVADLARELGATEAQLEACKSVHTVEKVMAVNAPRALKGRTG
jgi:hypothetical protein